MRVKGLDYRPEDSMFRRFWASRHSSSTYSTAHSAKVRLHASMLPQLEERKENPYICEDLKRPNLGEGWHYYNPPACLSIAAAS